MRKWIPILMLTAFTGMLSAVEPGGEIAFETLRSKALPVNDVPGTIANQKNKLQIIVFFDGAGQDTVPLMESLARTQRLQKESGTPVDVFALSSATKRVTKTSLGNVKIPFAIGADERKLLMKEYAAGDVLLPIALIVKNKKVQWKGSPMDLDAVLDLMAQGKYNPESQLKIDRLRREMQIALQSALPDVVIRCADAILQLQPGDTMSIQAKMFILESTGQHAAAFAFMKKTADENPERVIHTIRYFAYLLRTQNKTEWKTAFDTAVKRFSAKPSAMLQILSFAASLPIGWMLPADVLTEAEKLKPSADKFSAEEKVSLAVLMAHELYLDCRPNEAIKQLEDIQSIASQTEQGKEVQARLQYYKSVHQGR